MISLYKSCLGHRVSSQQEKPKTMFMADVPSGSLLFTLLNTEGPWDQMLFITCLA